MIANEIDTGYNQYVCTEHKNVKIEYYCRNCNDLICADCRSTAHERHDCEGVQGVKDICKELDSVIEQASKRQLVEEERYKSNISNAECTLQQLKEDLELKQQLTRRFTSCLAAGASVAEKKEAIDIIRRHIPTRLSTGNTTFLPNYGNWVTIQDDGSYGFVNNIYV